MREPVTDRVGAVADEQAGGDAEPPHPRVEPDGLR
jgi:hypothetical protein